MSRNQTILGLASVIVSVCAAAGITFAGELFPEYKGIATAILFILTLVGIYIFYVCMRSEQKEGIKMNDNNDEKEQQATIINNSGGGVGGHITVDGTGANGPVTGLHTRGLRINQTGTGVGLRLDVKAGGSNRTVGVRSDISHKEPD